MSEIHRSPKSILCLPGHRQPRGGALGREAPVWLHPPVPGPGLRVEPLPPTMEMGWSKGGGVRTRLAEKAHSIPAQLRNQCGRRNPVPSGFPIQILTLGPTLLRTTSSSHLKFEFGSHPQRKRKSLVKCWVQAPGCLGLNPGSTTDDWETLGKDLNLPIHKPGILKGRWGGMAPRGYDVFLLYPAFCVHARNTGVNQVPVLVQIIGLGGLPDNK